MSNPRLKHWINKSAEGWGILVSLNAGWCFLDDDAQGMHDGTFGSPREAKAAIKRAVKCHCELCQAELLQTYDYRES